MLSVSRVRNRFPRFCVFIVGFFFGGANRGGHFREILVCADLSCRGSCFRCWREHRQELKQRCFAATHPTMAQKTRQERPSRTPTRTRKHRHLSARTQNFGDGHHGSTWTMMDTIQQQMDWVAHSQRGIIFPSCTTQTHHHNSDNENGDKEGPVRDHYAEPWDRPVARTMQRREQRQE